VTEDFSEETTKSLSWKNCSNAGTYELILSQRIWTCHYCY